MKTNWKLIFRNLFVLQHQVNAVISLKHEETKRWYLVRNGIDYYDASLAEFAEFLESTNFKWWKVYPGQYIVDPRNVLMEIVDMLHFEISLLLLGSIQKVSVCRASSKGLTVLAERVFQEFKDLYLGESTKRLEAQLTSMLSSGILTGDRHLSFRALLGWLWRGLDLRCSQQALSRFVCFWMFPLSVLLYSSLDSKQREGHFSSAIIGNSTKIGREVARRMLVYWNPEEFEEYIKNIAALYLLKNILNLLRQEYDYGTLKYQRLVGNTDENRVLVQLLEEHSFELFQVLNSVSFPFVKPYYSHPKVVRLKEHIVEALKIPWR